MGGSRWASLRGSSTDDASVPYSTNCSTPFVAGAVVLSSFAARPESERRRFSTTRRGLPGNVNLVRVAGVESELELAFAVPHQRCTPMFDRLPLLPEPQ